VSHSVIRTMDKRNTTKSRILLTILVIGCTLICISIISVSYSFENRPLQTPDAERNENIISAEEQTFTHRKLNIGLIAIPGTKLVSIPKHENISFSEMKLECSHQYDRFAKGEALQFAYDFGMRDKEYETNYTFDQYREDISLSLVFYEHYKRKGLDKYDYLFIAPVGVKLDESFAESLYRQLNQAIDNHPKACFYQSYLPPEYRRKNGYAGTMKEIDVDYPRTGYRSISGAIIRPVLLEGLEFFSSPLYLLDRIDGNLQIYCQIGLYPIVAFGQNVYEVSSSNSFN